MRGSVEEKAHLGPLYVHTFLVCNAVEEPFAIDWPQSKTTLNKK